MKRTNNPDILKKIYKLRNEDKSWKEISSILKREDNEEMSDHTVKTKYEIYVSRASVITSTLREDKRRAKELQIDWNKKLEEKFKLIDETTNKLMRFVSELFENNKGDNLAIIKLIPSILAISREILNQLYFIKKQQEQIIVNQKNIIYSPLQIMNIINKEMKKNQKDNEIKIIDKKTGRVKEKLYIN